MTTPGRRRWCGHTGRPCGCPVPRRRTTPLHVTVRHPALRGAQRRRADERCAGGRSRRRAVPGGRRAAGHQRGLGRLPRPGRRAGPGRDGRGHLRLGGRAVPGPVRADAGRRPDAVGPDTYGTKPTTPALGAVLDAVAQAQRGRARLAGLLDLDAVGVFGHSAGGTVALQSARAEWFPQVRAVATYGAHTMASQQLGHAPGTLLAGAGRGRRCCWWPAPLTASSPPAPSATAQEAGAPGHDPIERTWDEALPPSTEAWLVRIADAGHMLPAAPEDPTSARGFLEEPTGRRPGPPARGPGRTW